MIVRRYTSGDERELWQLYHDTTHIINGRDYTAAQCDRWAPSICNFEKWKSYLSRTRPIVVVAENTIVGFADLDKDNSEIGYFYCHHNWQRRGVGKLLLGALEDEARVSGADQLTAEVSVTAEPFFTAMGFEVISKNEKIICDAPARNFTMRKVLPK